MKTITENKIEFTRINNDVNGNPRYVCHFTDIPRTEKQKLESVEAGMYGISKQYEQAIKNANKIGGKKFHNKQYGGGIVFQTYNVHDTERQINELLNS